MVKIPLVRPLERVVKSIKLSRVENKARNLYVDLTLRSIDLYNTLSELKEGREEYVAKAKSEQAVASYDVSLKVLEELHQTMEKNLGIFKDYLDSFFCEKPTWIEELAQQHFGIEESYYFCEMEKLNEHSAFISKVVDKEFLSEHA